MAKGYWIAHVSVKDAEHYPEYLKAGAIAYKKFGAKFLIRGGKFDAVEGQVRDRHVVVEYESYEKAVEAYHSPEYQAAAKLRQAYAMSDIMIIEGVEE